MKIQVPFFICRKAKETYVKLRKERDYHRMHHKRVVQEKNKLINDIKRYTMKNCNMKETVRTMVLLHHVLFINMKT